MQQNKKYTHSVMFHHFHDEDHVKSQGSISAEEFSEMLNWLLDSYKIINADDYIDRLEKDNLNSNEICLSFDDALLCQYDIAQPILNALKIKAFFFVYSSPLCGDPDPLEIYRLFRTKNFKNIDIFYDEFFLEVKKIDPVLYTKAQGQYDEINYLVSFPFYSKNDKWFRYLRDQALGKLNYQAIMDKMMQDKNFDIESASSHLWMSNANIQKLHEDGHIIGLHSYSHPTMLHTLTKNQQSVEYEKNFDHLSAILKSKPIAMSHPCGNYNSETLSILKRLGIRIGFRSSNSIKTIQSNLEIPRNDHANILREMRE
jgi:peptidoglycan/xylan/chitin deacetylase (PgdA/CDA1 family)